MRRGGERRGNTRNRRARKLWLLATFDPELGPDLARCRLVLSDRCLGLLDYFYSGSGTTARACKDEGRRCIAWEREERYCEIAARRLSQDTLFGGAA